MRQAKIFVILSEGNPGYASMAAAFAYCVNSQPSHFKRKQESSIYDADTSTSFEIEYECKNVTVYFPGSREDRRLEAITTALGKLGKNEYLTVLTLGELEDVAKIKLQLPKAVVQINMINFDTDSFDHLRRQMW